MDDAKEDARGVSEVGGVPIELDKGENSTETLKLLEVENKYREWDGECDGGREGSSDVDVALTLFPLWYLDMMGMSIFI